MRRRVVFGTVTLAVLIAVGSCKDDVGLTSIPPEPERFIAFMNGANVETPVTTRALGQAVFTVSGGSLIYRIDLSNIDSVTLAHIHRNPAGISGPVRVNLYIPPRTPTDSNFSGTLVEDTVPVADSILTLMRTGLAYVNVHTLRNPAGEIRGQVFRLP